MKNEKTTSAKNEKRHQQKIKNDISKKNEKTTTYGNPEKRMPARVRKCGSGQAFFIGSGAREN